MEDVQIKRNVLDMKIHTVKGPKYWKTYEDEVDIIILEMNGKFYGTWNDPDYEEGLLELMLFGGLSFEEVWGYLGNSVDDVINQMDESIEGR